MSSTDARIFLDAGLDVSKVRLMFFAFDDDCLEVSTQAKNPKSVLLASKYGSRKGLHILPSLVHSMPDWEFIATGRGWKSFIRKQKLGQLSNFKYIKFDKKRKLEIYSTARVFLSLSELEGGPVPLLETIAMNLIPIATDTGFAADLIEDGKNGFIIPTKPTLEILRDAMEKSLTLESSTNYFVRNLTWNRISKFIENDLQNIKKSFKSDSRQPEI
jgi:glycosyltransferase involved in cell wall biosynthesis